MKGEPKFFLCKECNNLVGMIFEGGGALSCCGQKMKELVPNTTEAAGEKHLPVISIDGNTVTVKVGEVAHPMLPEHHIDWIYINTSKGGQRKSLEIGAEPKAVFELAEGEKLVSAYAYCNLHSLWVTKV
ncbi:desulfoferrodoxin family protein [Acetanaerobacterium elongatum]|uniref:Desulfoferrodoxin n=1 Tax=Acetanaerobacterium elongatum TaxID=258515 RepID=A0A1H0D3S7_9FIRM|nr:desulfoferrodoxin family protein [Acetanaerobacterium elongatum]SDN64812.1 superoxide reductase [Acetanaerobacterium elongatum]